MREQQNTEISEVSFVWKRYRRAEHNGKFDISNTGCKPDQVTPEQPGADNRDDETTTGFLEQRIQFERASSEIIRLSVPLSR